MVIERAVAPVDKTTGRSLRFTIDLVEILFTDTEIVRYSPDVVDPEGPAANRTSEVDGGDRASPVVMIDRSELPSLVAPSGPQVADLIAVQEVPLSGDARQTFRTRLGEKAVRVSSWWQDVDGAHYMSLVGLDAEPIATGLRLVEGGQPLRNQAVDLSGDLFVSGRGALTRRAWQDTHRLLYAPPGT